MDPKCNKPGKNAYYCDENYFPKYPEPSQGSSGSDAAQSSAALQVLQDKPSIAHPCDCDPMDWQCNLDPSPYACCAIYMYCDWENNIHAYSNAPKDTLCKPANYHCEGGGFVPNANVMNLAADYLSLSSSIEQDALASKRHGSLVFYMAASMLTGALLAYCLMKYCEYRKKQQVLQKPCARVAAGYNYLDTNGLSSISREGLVQP